MTKHISKVTRGIMGAVLAAMIVVSAGAVTVSKAASKTNPASYAFSCTPENSYSYTSPVKKDNATGKANIVPSFFYNYTNGTVYYRVVHGYQSTYATELKKITNSYSFKLSYVSTNTDNKYRLRASVENATKGYIATKGSWWP